MRNHDEKVTDIIRSVLPSTARNDARNTRKHIHRAERRSINAALQRGDNEPLARDSRDDFAELVADRRGADKTAPLVRWALHHARTSPKLCGASLDEQVDYFRQLLPDNTIGRHALSHIALPLELAHPDSTWRWSGRFYRPLPDRGAPIEPLVRVLYEAGYHRELNHRLKTVGLLTLAGVADIERFAGATDRSARSVIRRLCAEVHLS